MKSSAEFECECKATTMVEFQEPEVFRPTMKEVKCSGCDAEWLMRFRRDLNSTRILATHKLTKPSRKLGEYLEKKKQHQQANAPQKKPFQLFVK